MNLIILSFLGLAVVIIVLAIVLTKLFRKPSNKGDLNRDRDDATDHATWIGIRKSMDDDHDY